MESESANPEQGDPENAPSPSKVVIIAENERFLVEKQLLMSKCDYFNAMFSGSYKESSQREISIQMVTAQALKFILEYFKTNTLGMIDLRNVADVLNAANYLHLSSLRRLIVDKLLSFLNFESCFTILQVSKECNLSDLEMKVKSFALYSFSDLVNNITQIKDLAVLRSYLAHENLNVDNEYEVFKAGMEWLKYHNRENDVLTVLSCILYKNLDIASIKNIMNDSKLLNDQAGEILNGIYQLYNTISLSPDSSKKDMDRILNNYNAETRDIIYKLISTQRSRTASLKPHILKNVKGKFDLMSYDTGTKQLQKYISIPELHWWGHSVVPWKGFQILVLCGKLKDENTWNHEIRVFNCLTGVWSTLPTFSPTPRRHATVLVDGDDIYIIGGLGVYRVVLCTVQSYNIGTGTWTDLPSFPEFSNNVVAAFHKGKLFVSGEKLYVLKEDHWQILFHLPTKYSAMISYKDRLYFGEKWRNKLWYLEYNDETDQKQLSTVEFMATHYNVTSFCRIGNTAYLFSSGEEFENSISVESCRLDYDTAASKTDLLWLDENSDGKYDPVSSCFTLALLDVEDTYINDCGDTLLKRSET